MALFKSKVLFDTAMIVIQELLGLRAMVLAILQVVEAGDFRFESGLDCGVLLQLREEDVKLLKLRD